MIMVVGPKASGGGAVAEGERKDCCGSTPAGVAHVLDDKLRLGRQRQLQVRRTVAWLSVALCVAAVALSVTATGSLRDVASRLAWAAMALAAPRVLRAIRDVMTGCYPVHRVLAIFAILAVGVIGYPLIPAIAAALALVTEVARRPDPSAATGVPLGLSSEVS